MPSLDERIITNALAEGDYWCKTNIAGISASRSSGRALVLEGEELPTLRPECGQ